MTSRGDPVARTLRSCSTYAGDPVAIGIIGVVVDKEVYKRLSGYVADPTEVDLTIKNGELMLHNNLRITTLEA